MTDFNPKFAREVLERRQRDLNRRAGDLHLEKFVLQMEGKIGYSGNAAAEFDKEIQSLWAQADSYDSVLAYLDGRIWGEKTRAEKIWETMKDWSPKAGAGMVEDVFEAADLVDNGLKPF